MKNKTLESQEKKCFARDYNYFQKLLQKKLRNSLGTYPHKKDALQIGSAGLHLRNVISLRDTQGMEKDHKNCKYFNNI